MTLVVAHRLENIRRKEVGWVNNNLTHSLGWKSMLRYYHKGRNIGMWSAFRKEIAAGKYADLQQRRANGLKLVHEVRKVLKNEPGQKISNYLGYNHFALYGRNISSYSNEFKKYENGIWVDVSDLMDKKTIKQINKILRTEYDNNESRRAQEETSAMKKARYAAAYNKIRESLK